MFSIALLVFPFAVFASDPSGLFWPIVIGLVFIGTFIFAVSVPFILHFIQNKHYKSLLLGLSFGLSVGPIYVLNNTVLPNIANLFTAWVVKESFLPLGMLVFMQ